MTPKSCICEIGLERPRKRGLCQVSIVEGHRKRPLTSDHRVKGQRGRSQRRTCGKVHKGVYCSKGLGYYKVAGLVMSAKGDKDSWVY